MKTRILIEVDLDDMESALRHINMHFGEKLTRLSIEEVKPVDVKPVTYTAPKPHTRDRVQWTNE